MFLATGVSFDFMQFLQIISWILIPVLFLAVVLTIFFHYRRKKLEDPVIDPIQKLMVGSPELVGYTKGDGEFVCFDHSPLISEYKNRLTLTHARFTALHHDFEKLESRYQSMAGYAIAHFKNKNESLMKSAEKLPRQLQEEIDRLAAKYTSEKEEMTAKLDQLNQAFKSLEEENKLLQDQLAIQNASGQEKDVIVERWKEENRALKDKVAEHQYLQDILDEKKTQIDYLQYQLEQRIIRQHELANEKSQLQDELADRRNQYKILIQLNNNLEKELLHQKEMVDKLQVELCAKEEQIAEQQLQLAAKQDLTRVGNGVDW